MGGNYCFIDGNLAFTRQCCTTVPSVGDTVTGFMIECDQGQRWKYRALSVSPANSKASTNQSAVNSKQTRYAWYYCFVCPSLNVGLPAWCPQVVWCHLLHSQMSPFWENVTQKGNNCERNTIDGRISHFLPWWLRAGRQSVISQGKIAWSTSPQLGIEPTPWENRPRDTFILPLSFHPPGPRRGQTVRCIPFPAELSWPGATEKTDSEVHSFSLWVVMTRATERTDSEVHSFSLWAIMTRATEKKDSEIHSFSHWAIMTRAMERTDSEIHSFPHWAIITRATGRTDSEIHSFSHCAIMTRGHEEDRQWDTFIPPPSYHEEDRQWDTSVVFDPLLLVGSTETLFLLRETLTLETCHPEKADHPLFLLG